MASVHASSRRLSSSHEARENQLELLNDYRELPACEAQVVRLLITNNPYRGELGLIDFTLFGDVANGTIELAHADE